MDSKKKQFILIPLVLGLWGYIFYMIISSIGAGDSQDDNVYHRPTIRQTAVASNEELSLSDLSYADPFLKRVRRQRSGLKKNKPQQESPVQVENPETILEDFQPYGYQGYVVKPNSTKKVGLLKLKGKQILCQEGEMILDGIKVKKIKKGIIVINIQGKEVSIRSSKQDKD